MLPSIAFRATRCLPNSLRTMSTANNQNILNEALQELSFSKEKATLSAPPKDLQSTPRNSNKPPVLDIPPAEDPLLRYITSSLTKHGHRARAARIVSQMLMHIHAWTRTAPVPIVQQAILDAAPAVRTLSHRTGGKTVHKPVALNEKQRTRRAVQAILGEVEKKQGRLPEKLAKEILGILRRDPNNAVLKKKEELHRHTMVNRGNAKTRI